MKRALCIAATVAAFAACDDGPGKAWLVDRPRVLGARFEGSAVTWLVASPGAPPQFGWAFATCAAPSGNFASPRCDGPVATSGTGTADREDVRMDVGAVTETTLVVAAFCGGGVPSSFDPRSFEATCASGAEPLLASVKGPAAGNRNPPIADGAIVTPPACVRPEGPEEQLGFRFEDAQREPGESLLLATFVTGGELDHTYAALESGEAAPKDVRVAWKPPADEGEVKVFFVLRDGRGGTTFVRRNVCVRR